MRNVELMREYEAESGREIIRYLVGEQTPNTDMLLAIAHYALWLEARVEFQKLLITTKESDNAERNKD